MIVDSHDSFLVTILHQTIGQLRRILPRIFENLILLPHLECGLLLVTFLRNHLAALKECLMN